MKTIFLLNQHISNSKVNNVLSFEAQIEMLLALVRCAQLDCKTC